MGLLRTVIVLGIGALVGCGGSGGVAVKAPGFEQVKPTLEGYARSGQLDSGFSIVREQVQKLKQNDAAKAEQLLKELDELQALRDPASIKTKAKKIVDQL